jgi:hypothetical protein
MHPTTLLRLAAFSLFLPLAGTASAQTQACLLEGNMSFGGKKTEIRDCLQAKGIPAAQFKEMCGGISQSAAAMGGPPAKISYMGSCPAAAQGVCEGMFGGPVAGYYYRRDAAALADTRQSCAAAGGKWK